MKIYTKVLVPFIILLLFSCGKKQSNIEFEQTVFYEVFPAIVDSMRLSTEIAPPPPRPIYDDEGNFVGVDTIEWIEMEANFEKEKLAFSHDSINCSAIVSDNIYELAENDILNFSKVNNLAIKDLDSNNSKLKYRIDISNLRSSKSQIQFIYSSEFNRNKDYRKSRYFSENLGVIGFSRIQFNKDKTKGVLNCFHYKGNIEESHFRIFIKNIKNIWLIEHTYITYEL